MFWRIVVCMTFLKRGAQARTLPRDLVFPRDSATDKLQADSISEPGVVGNLLKLLRFVSKFPKARVGLPLSPLAGEHAVDLLSSFGARILPRPPRTPLRAFFFLTGSGDKVMMFRTSSSSVFSSANLTGDSCARNAIVVGCWMPVFGVAGVHAGPPLET